MSTGRHLDELRQHVRDRAERRTSEPPAVDDPPSDATVLAATNLILGMVRWRDASPEARHLARSWGDRPPADEPRGPSR